jgi:ABC-type transporter Mla MlaB component
MVPPVVFLAWNIFHDVKRPIAEIEPSDLVGNGGMDLDPRLAVFHIRRDASRQGLVHRMPNLQAWAERLPAKAEVVVLDLEQVNQIDANSVLELRAVLHRMRDQHRHLILAGLSHGQVEQLRSATGDVLDPRDVCPDLELAIAKGLNLLSGQG